MTTPTHDLAIARAERDAWQSTCEELHRTIAGRDVEIEAHLGRCEAADQRARSLEAALTAEREAGRGLVAQVDALRKDLAHAQERLAERRTAQRGEVERLEAERDRLRDELRAIRDLVAPGNPQGTVVDAVRAMATGLIESIGARDAAEQARDMARDSRDAAIARAEKAEADLRIMSRARDNATKAVHTLSGLYDDSKAELAKLRAELAELTITHDRLLAREHEDGRLHAQLRVELAELRAPKKHPSAPDRCPKCEWTNVGLVNFGAPGAPLWLCHGCAARTIAELRARPVLTVEALDAAAESCGYGSAVIPGFAAQMFAALGPVTLPSPDRLATLESHLRDIHSGADDAEAKEAWLYCAELINAEARALAKLSPDPAPTLDAAFLRRVLVATKHGPNGKGGPGPCDAACVKCEAELMAKAAPAREVAPTLVAVSDEELAEAFDKGRGVLPRDPHACLAGIRAVRAKLGAAVVTAEALAEAWWNQMYADGRAVCPWHADALENGREIETKRAANVIDRLRAAAAKGG